MIRRSRPSFALALLCLLPFPAAAAPAADDAWLLEDTADAVTPYDETLVLIDAPAPGDLYRIRNQVILTADSLHSGWIRIEQCHENLDPVPDLQIVYRPGRIDWIRLRGHSNIGRVRIEDLSVQLQDIQPGARLCLTLRKRMSNGEREGEYRLSHGPFYRQFLDGYYPMQLIYRLDYPAGRATAGLLNREQISGTDIRESAGRLEVEAHFAGRFKLDLLIRSRSSE